MKWSAFLGTMSLYLQEQQICDSEIIFERIRFFLTSGYFFPYLCHLKRFLLSIAE